MGTTLIAGCVTHKPAVELPATPQYDSVSAAIKPPDDMSWINPGKVFISGFYPGARAESTLLLYNGSDDAVPFSVTFRTPDNVEDGYAMPPPEAQNWVTVDDPAPVLAPKETRALLIALEMPEEAISPADRWEFWISVMDTAQGGMVREELASRWLITMRE